MDHDLEQGISALPDYLDGLNPPQREAVLTLDGPLLLLAGAGTGKTRALTARIAHILHMGKARPDQILAVTFTNKAAHEMKERVIRLIGPMAEGMPWLGTFHAISVKILRRYADLAGLKSNFSILDADDQLRLLKQLVKEAGIDDKKWPARLLLGVIEGWKNRALGPSQVPLAETGAYNRRGAELYALYQARLKALNACDFGDLLVYCVQIFQSYPDVLAQYHRRFRYIMVDEYQDTNVAQYLWLRLLAQGHGHICCVGDDDQSIYGWRGAEVENILRFEKDFAGAKIIRLEQNYRSTGHILGAASGVIAANQARLGKNLWTDADSGEQVRLIGHWDAEQEASWTGDEIEALARGTGGRSPQRLNDMAILVRTGHQMRSFEERFLMIGLPYRVIGGPRFYERLEIRDALAYFRLALNFDDDLAFERIINTPKRGLGDKAQHDIQRNSRANGISLLESARDLLQEGAVKGKGANALRRFVDDMDRWHATAQTASYDHIALAEQILAQSGYRHMWKDDKTPEAAGRLENLDELIKALEQYDDLQEFLEHIALILDREVQSSDDKVTLMTLHGAKGLEFPVVFLPGWEEGLFPSQRSIDELGIKGLEEERRLAYVGITRARMLCTISYAANRRVYGQWQNQLPSRFIDELPAPHMDVRVTPGLMTRAYGGQGGDGYNSPGWQRLQDHVPVPKAASPKMAAETAFRAGDRVFHQKFGYGAVMVVDDERLEIVFDHGGIKRVIAQFVTPAGLAGDMPF